MVVIQNSIHATLVNEKNIRNALEQVLADLDKADSELLIRIVDTAEIQRLNKTYRQQDQPTNVLAFPSDLPIEIDEAILGDVVICTHVVAEQAQAQGKRFEHHLLHMAVHGTLHLLGYDHIDAHQADEMERLEIQILQKLAIKNPY